MLNVLIVEDNVIQCKELVNFISSSFPYARLYSMSYNGKDAIKILGEDKVDIIFLDLMLPDMSGNKILEYIESNNKKKYLNSVIIISGALNYYPELYKNPYVYATIPKPINFDLIIKYLKSFVGDEELSNNNLKIKEIIYQELKFLCFNMSHIGTHYLCDSIYHIYLNGNHFNNLSKNVYSIIAKNHSTTVNNVKCCIFQATVYSYFECEENAMNSYFGYQLISKPKTIDIINQVLSHIPKKD